MTPDLVVKESLTTERDTAYREGFEACREMAAKVAESHSDYESDNEAQRTAYAIEKKIRAIPTPTTKGGA